MSQWKNHYAIWIAYNFSYIIGSLLFFCQNHFSSFSSLQDDRISTVEMHILQKIQILCKSYVLIMICAHPCYNVFTFHSILTSTH
jgi:hypothetical protein